MGEKIPYKARKPGGGRKKRKPEYDAGKKLKEQLDAAVVLYDSEMSLQAIADALSLNPIKVRKLLITAGVYESDTAKLVRQTFNTFRETQDYPTAVTSTMAALQLSRPSVTSYLPYEKGVYFPETAEAENISAGAERQRHYRAVVALKKNPCEENLWKCVVAFRGYKFKTMSSLPFTYTLKRAGEMSLPRSCGSTVERTARALLGVPCCWRITISVKSERSWTDPRLWEISEVCRIFMEYSTDLA